MATDEAPIFSRASVAEGLPARRASTLLYAIEARTALLAARARRAMARFETERSAAEHEQQFLSALAEGRSPGGPGPDPGHRPARRPLGLARPAGPSPPSRAAAPDRREVRTAAAGTRRACGPRGGRPGRRRGVSAADGRPSRGGRGRAAVPARTAALATGGAVASPRVPAAVLAGLHADPDRDGRWRRAGPAHRVRGVRSGGRDRAAGRLRGPQHADRRRARREHHP